MTIHDSAGQGNTDIDMCQPGQVRGQGADCCPHTAHGHTVCKVSPCCDVECIAIMEELLRGLGMKGLYNLRLSHYMKTKFKGNILDGIAEFDSELRYSNECTKLDMRELFSKTYMTELCLSVHISSCSALCELCFAVLFCSALLCFCVSVCTYA
jgi:hypothetical protein